mgnify:CR=1 FL=1
MNRWKKLPVFVRLKVICSAWCALMRVIDWMILYLHPPQGYLLCMVCTGATSSTTRPSSFRLKVICSAWCALHRGMWGLWSRVSASRLSALHGVHWEVEFPDDEGNLPPQGYLLCMVCTHARHRINGHAVPRLKVICSAWCALAWGWASTAKKSTASRLSALHGVHSGRPVNNSLRGAPPQGYLLCMVCTHGVFERLLEGQAASRLSALHGVHSTPDISTVFRV